MSFETWADLDDFMAATWDGVKHTRELDSGKVYDHRGDAERYLMTPQREHSRKLADLIDEMYRKELEAKSEFWTEKETPDDDTE